MIPAVFGLAGTMLGDEERDFFREARPAGYILFARNIENRDQLRRLTDDLRTLEGRDDLPILIDQEGGRVQRMTAPEWRRYPPGEAFDRLFDVAPASAIEAARLNARALGADLREVGINVDCLPLLDVRQEGASDVIGDRALGREPMRVAALGRAILDGLGRSGVVGIVKHIPGHGRAVVDSHEHLPVVDASEEELAIDMQPFEALKDAPMAMTAHIVYTAWDEEHCATLSRKIIRDVIRGRIGFDGLLFSDDLDMKALEGDMGERAAAVIAAGCDVALNCWAKMDDMQAIASRLGPMSEVSQKRLDRAMKWAVAPDTESDGEELVARRDALLKQIG